MTPLQFIQAIAEIALIEKAKGNDLFFEYSPHVESVDTRYFKGGWTSEKQKGKQFKSIYISDFDEQEAAKYLQEILL